MQLKIPKNKIKIKLTNDVQTLATMRRTRRHAVMAATWMDTEMSELTVASCTESGCSGRYVRVRYGQRRAPSRLATRLRSVISALAVLGIVARCEEPHDIVPDDDMAREALGMSVWTPHCYISVGECIAHPSAAPAAASFADDTYPSGYDSEFAAVNLGVHRGADLCLPRAVDWHAYCQNGPDIPVTATYTPTGESLTYPPDTAAEDLPSHQLWPPPPPSCRWPSEGQTGAGEGVAQRLKVAVVVAGQLFRFAYETLYDGVVHPNVEAGHEVDVFIYLARDDAGGLHNHRHWAQRETEKPNGDPRMEESLRERVAASIASPRSSLRGWDVGNHWRLVEELGEYRFAQWRGKDRTARVHQYEGW